MTTPPAPDRATPAPPTSALERRVRMRLTRGVSATWWYTVAGVLFIEIMVVPAVMATMLELGRPNTTMLVVGGAVLVWGASTMLLLREYRRRLDGSPWQSRGRLIAPVAIAVAVAILAGVLSGSWLIGSLPLVQTLMLINWPPGVRVRLVITATVFIAALWFVDGRMLGTDGIPPGWFFLGFYAVAMPSITVLSLWWWDVLMTLDLARASEARLAATQERLRVATDVHDLQGHHLQVIALQLELAERLLRSDPDAALDQLRAARRSVDDARQGTRDLATRFRSVPLRDELANAVDLLRAAGISAESTVDAAADRAPASVLGPIIRETTTNVLRHGGGEWARLSLSPEGGAWRYAIANDAHDLPDTDTGGGAGLDGIARRVDEAGGTLEVRRGAAEFTVVVTVDEGAVAP